MSSWISTVRGMIVQSVLVQILIACCCGGIISVLCSLAAPLFGVTAPTRGAFHLFAFAAGAATGIISFLVLRLFTMRSMRAIARGMSSTRKGDEFDLTMRLTENGGAIGGISQAYNVFIDQMRGLVDAMHKNLSLSKNQRVLLTKSMEQTTRVIADISSAISALRDTADRQTAEAARTEDSLTLLNNSVLVVMTHTAELVSEMSNLTDILSQESSAVEDIIKQIDDMARTVTLISTLSDDADKTTIELTALSGEGGEHVRATSAALLDAKESVAKVRAIVEGISVIANKTNTLSVNAAIEAVRAGAAGKGFGVVAGEIRKLADTTSRMGGDAQAVLDEIIAKIGGSSQKMTATEKSFATVRDRIGTLKGIVGQVRAGNDQSRTAAEAFTRNTEIIRGMAVTIQEKYGDVDGTLSTIKDRLSSLKEATDVCVNAMAELVRLATAVREASVSIDDGTAKIGKSAERVSREIKDADTWIAGMETLVSRYRTKAEANRETYR
ncbi:MAG: methyl-accepting chemotaxis protein [Spirochaetota bacterium]